MSEPTKDEIIANLEARLASIEEGFSRMEDWVIEFQDEVLPYLVLTPQRMRELNYRAMLAKAKKPDG